MSLGRGHLAALRRTTGGGFLRARERCVDWGNSPAPVRGGERRRREEEQTERGENELLPPPSFIFSSFCSCAELTRDVKRLRR